MRSTQDFSFLEKSLHHRIGLQSGNLGSREEGGGRKGDSYKACTSSTQWGSAAGAFKRRSKLRGARTLTLRKPTEGQNDARAHSPTTLQARVAEKVEAKKLEREIKLEEGETKGKKERNLLETDLLTSCRSPE